MAISRSGDDVVIIRNVSSSLKILKRIPPNKPINKMTPVYGIRREANIVLKRPFVTKQKYELSKLRKKNYIQPINRIKKRNISLYGAWCSLLSSCILDPLHKWELISVSFDFIEDILLCKCLLVC